MCLYKERTRDRSYKHTTICSFVIAKNFYYGTTVLEISTHHLLTAHRGKHFASAGKSPQHLRTVQTSGRVGVVCRFGVRCAV